MKIINYSAILLATLFLAACQKDEQPAEFGSDTNAVHIDATVGGSLFTRSNPMAPDAATQKKFNTGDRISIVADGQAAVVYAFDGTNWAPETSDQYLKWETNAMDFSAFYPVTTGTSLTAFTLPTDQSSEALIANADYMSLTQQLSKPAGSNTADLILERQMARIIVEIAGFGDQYTVQQHSVSNVRIFSAANTIGGSIPTAITPYVINGTGGTGSQGSSYTALIIPAAAQDAQDFITLTDGAGKTLSVKGIPAIEAGKSYTYTLTVGKDALTVGNVTVEDWTTGTPIPGGEAFVVVEAGPDNYTVSKGDNILFKGNGSETTGQIIIKGTATVTIQDINIKPSVPASLPEVAKNRVLSPIVIADGTATIKLKGKNTLESTEFITIIEVGNGTSYPESSSGAGIQLVNNNSHVIIEGEANASLTVSSKWGCAAIGGNLNGEVGNITIKNATINASTTDNYDSGAGAAIGSGSSAYSGTKKASCGVITIINSDITASVSSDGKQSTAVIGSGEAVYESETNSCEGINIHLQKGQTKDAFLNKLTGGTTSKVGAGGGNGTNSCSYVNWYNSDGILINK